MSVPQSATAVLILAAGSSRRLGRPKQLELWEGETLLARAIRIAREAAVGPVSAVLRLDQAQVLAEAQRLGCPVIRNDEADEGMASSLRAGVHAVAGSVDGALFMACDQPAVTAGHLRELVRRSGGNLIGSAYGGRHGIPAWFPSQSFPNLLKLRGDTGARALLLDAPGLALPNGEWDLDTEEDLGDARHLSQRTLEVEPGQKA